MSPELLISILALVISILTAWFSLFHRGSLKMSRPAFLAFVVEDVPFGGWLKIFIRSLLFSTGSKGHVVESIILTLKHNNEIYPFHYWMYGDKEELEIGSGLFVEPTGVAANHHFTPTQGIGSKSLTVGQYEIDIHANILGDNKKHLLQSIKFNLGSDEVDAITKSKHVAVYLRWDLETQSYKTFIDNKRDKTLFSSR